MRTSLALLVSSLIAFSSAVAAAPSRLSDPTSSPLANPDGSLHTFDKRAVCSSGTFKFAGKCVKTCPINTYADKALRKCTWCSTIPDRKGIGASRCSATEALKCPLLYLLDGRCVKAKSCPVGTWADKLTHECSSCPGDGKTCDGWGILTCKTKLKYGRSCVDECPERTYLNAAKKECFACTDKDARQCTQRAATKCTFKYLDAGVCRDTCSAGKYAAWYTRTCEPCKDKNAITCTPYKSLTCKGKMIVKNGVCVDPTPICEANQFLNVTANACVACTTVDKNALTCTSIAALSCGNSTFLSSNGTCVTNCVNSFGNSTSHVCEATGSCPPDTTFLNTTTNGCVTCSSRYEHSVNCDSAHALSCSPGFPLENGACVTNCTTGNYLNSTANACESCSTRFAHSTVCTADKVLDCETGYPLQEGVCVSVCDDTHFYNSMTGDCDLKVDCPVESGTFANTTLNTCVECDEEFYASLTCNSTTVFSCAPGSPLKAGRCLESCDTDTEFYNSTTNLCDGLAQCADGFEVRNATTNTCIGCPTLYSNSLSCNATAALSCDTGFFVKAGECIPLLTSCETDEYLNANATECVPCTTVDENALTCTSTAALTCGNSTYLSQNSTCVSECLGSFANATSRACEPILVCPDTAFLNATVNGCVGCNVTFNHSLTCDETEPFTCAPGFPLSNGSCVNDCTLASGTYLNETLNECLACSGRFNSSLTCTVDEAVSCTQTTLLDQGACVGSCNSTTQFTNTLNMTCDALADCESTIQVRNTSTNLCQNCPDLFSNSIQCNATVAVTCDTGFFVKAGECIPLLTSCETDEYLNANATECIACSTVDENALTCTSTAALSCGSSTYLNNGTCVSECVGSFANFTSRICEPLGSCPSATTYLSPTTNGCVNCNSTFNHSLTCDPTRPLTCAPGFPLNNGSCVGNCSTSQYLNTTANRCDSCSTRFNNSLTCSSTNALSCKPDFPLQNGSCVTACDTSLYVFNNATKNCDTKVSCPVSSGTYQNGTQNSCTNCNSTFQAALTCNSTTVFSCAPGSPLKAGRCLGSCNNSTEFYNATTNLCDGLAQCSNTTEIRNTTTNTCIGCATIYPNASTCNSTSIIKCATGYHLENRVCVKDIPICETDEYLNANSTACVACSTVDQHALTCTSTAALTCGSSTYLNNGSCVSECVGSFANFTSRICEPLGSCSSNSTYLNPKTNACQLCNSTFANSTTCTSSGPTNCSSGLVVSNNTCTKVVQTTTPVSSCNGTSGSTTTTNGSTSTTIISTTNSTNCSAPVTTTPGSTTTVITNTTASSNCSSTQFLSPSNSTCLNCSVSFANSTSCTSSGPTACDSSTTLVGGACLPVYYRYKGIISAGSQLVPSAKTPFACATLLAPGSSNNYQTANWASSQTACLMSTNSLDQSATTNSVGVAYTRGSSNQTSCTGYLNSTCEVVYFPGGNCTNLSTGNPCA